MYFFMSSNSSQRAIQYTVKLLIMTFKHARTDRTFKILFIGDSSVGKTCIMFRYADNEYFERSIPTIGVDFKMKTINARGKTIQLQLWDTAGQEKFFNLTRNYYRNAHAVVLVYDRTQASSFQHVERWLKCIADDAPENVLRILVGNKNDLHHRLVISTQDGRRLAEKYQMDFFETSAKSEKDTNISQMFDLIIEKLLNQDKSESAQSTDIIDLRNNQSTTFYERLVGCCSLTKTNET